MNHWLPMDSAPLDGTWILVRLKPSPVGPPFMVVRFIVDGGACHCHRSWCQCMKWKPEGWWTHGLGDPCDPEPETKLGEVDRTDMTGWRPINATEAA